jgi:ribosomal protein S18 acetylase RimI-like enzyme
MEIRPLEIAEVGLLEQLVDEFVSSHMMLSFKPDYHAAFRDWANRLTEDPEATILIARDKSDILGMAIGTVLENGPLISPDKIGYIPMFVVSSKHRRKGAGRSLWESLRGWLSSKGMREVQLYTQIDSDESRLFWESFGFTAVLERRRKWIGGSA